MKHTGFRHEALIYDNPDDFLAGTVPFLRAALETGEPALVAVSRANTELLEGELGSDTAGIRFAAMEELGRNPARIIPFWRDFVDEQGGRPARGIGEPLWPGRDAAEIDECQRHEALLNVAFPSQPQWSLLCPYDGRALADEVIDAVANSHEIVVSGGVRERTAGVDAGEDCFAGDLPRHPRGVDAFAFNRGKLAEVRRRVERGAKAAGLSRHAVTDLITAASELAANSVVHGGGAGTLRIWREKKRFLVEFQDEGMIEEPLVGRLRPQPIQPGGRGLWLANQLCDLVQIRSDSAGTRVRLQAVTG